MLWGNLGKVCSMLRQCVPLSSSFGVEESLCVIVCTMNACLPLRGLYVFLYFIVKSCLKLDGL